MTAPMTAPHHQHKFNDDLLMNEDDRRLAASQYPTIYHVLDHPELRQLFAEYDAPANQAKSRGRLAGVWAIALGFAALALAALELGFHAPEEAGPQSHSEYLLSVGLAIVSGSCGLASILIGSVGVLLARRKRDWLQHRLMGERIRQFYFQLLIFRLPQILKSMKSDAAKAAFTAERSLWFDAFKARLVGKLDSAFAAAIEEEKPIDLWLHDAPEDEAAAIADDDRLKPVFDAYRELRLLRQVSFTNYKLQDDHKFISSMPRRQLAILSQLTVVWVILLCVAHFGIVLGAVDPRSVFANFHSTEVTVGIIWLALGALATRAIEQGLQPEREIERYQQYRSSLRAILERYDAAPSQAAKLQIMREMERVAFDEMRNFLITNERSRFVM